MFNLEKTEKLIIIFLVSALLLGAGIAIYQKKHSTADIRFGRFAAQGPDAGGHDIAFTSAKININRAEAGELVRLKGVGKVLAQRIVDYRSSKGPFASADDVKNVKGIGPALFDKIKDDICVD